jgi:hypothetical protein
VRFLTISNRHVELSVGMDVLSKDSSTYTSTCEYGVHTILMVHHTYNVIPNIFGHTFHVVTR